jgi:hypothetical protein
MAESEGAWTTVLVVPFYGSNDALYLDWVPPWTSRSRSLPQPDFFCSYQKTGGFLGESETALCVILSHVEYKREIGGTFDVFQIIGQLARVPPLVLLLTGAGRIRSITITITAGVLQISSSTHRSRRTGCVA